MNSEHNFDNKLTTKLKELFPNGSLFLTDEENIKYSYESECFEIDVNEKSMKIEQINKCGYSGNKILNKLIELSKHLELEKIYLTDTSKIIWNEIPIKLSTIKILTECDTWYTAKGFKGKEYDAEKQTWQLLQNQSVNDSFNMISHYKPKMLKLEHYLNSFIRWYIPEQNSFFKTEMYIMENFDNIISECIEYIEKTIHNVREMTNKELFDLIVYMLKNSNNPTKDEIKLIYIIVAIFTPLIPYDEFLTMKI